MDVLALQTAVHVFTHALANMLMHAPIFTLAQVVGQDELRLEAESLDAATCEGLADTSTQIRSLHIEMIRQVLEHDVEAGSNQARLALNFLRWTATRAVNMLLGDAVLFAESLAAIAPSLVIMAVGTRTDTTEPQSGPSEKDLQNHSTNILGYDVQVTHLQRILAEGPGVDMEDLELLAYQRSPQTTDDGSATKAQNETIDSTASSVQASVPFSRRNLPRTWAEIHAATNRNSVEELRAMLNPGTVNLTDPTNGDSPIHVAAENGHVEVVKILIKFSANLNAQNGTGECTLELAEPTIRPSSKHQEHNQKLISVSRSTTQTLHHQVKLRSTLRLKMITRRWFCFC